MQNINISITGADVQERELMSNVITNALVKEGYSNVALVNTIGEPMVGSEVQSLGDVLRRSHPDFLERQVRVWSIPLEENIQHEMRSEDNSPLHEGRLVTATIHGDGIAVYHPWTALNPKPSDENKEATCVDEMNFLDANPQLIA